MRAGSLNLIVLTFECLAYGDTRSFCKRDDPAEASSLERQFEPCDELLDFRWVGRTGRALDDAAGKVWREQLDEVELVLAQQPAATEPDPGRMRGKQVRRVDVHEVGIAFGFDRHARHDADAESEPDVRLDD